jgi:hypothetical protein
MNKAIANDTGYVRSHRPLSGASANVLLILNAHTYVPGEGEDVPDGTHDKIITKYGRPDIVEVLEKEFRAQAWKVIVSRKCRLSWTPTDELTWKSARLPRSATRHAGT